MSHEPRNPKDLKALLRFCMEATKSEDAPNASECTEMTEERRKWLESVLNDISVDVIKELTTCISILSDEERVSNPDADEAQLERQMAAFDTLEDWVGNIDMANNFHKLGGFEALRMCLASPHSSITAGACHTIAELSQNNPYCQEHFVSGGFLSLLLKMLTSHNDAETLVKTIYAISCICRDNPTGQQKLEELGGFPVLLRTLEETKIQKLRTKLCFFLASLCSENSLIKSELTRLGLVHGLVSVLRLDHDPSHEHACRALMTLIEDNGQAVALCKDESLGLRQLLQSKIQLLKNEEESAEEVQYCQTIMSIVFN